VKRLMDIPEMHSTHITSLRKGRRAWSLHGVEETKTRGPFFGRPSADRGFDPEADGPKVSRC
jgi:hypothetical protein